MTYDQHVYDWDRACSIRAKYGHFDLYWAIWVDKYR